MAAPLDPDASLEDVVAWAADGRALEAIDVLSRRNRISPDPRVERALVELRHAAFDQLSREPGRPSWPPAFDDPFPGEESLPETPADRFSGDLLGGAITHHGALCVRGLIDASAASSLREQIDRSFEARERHMRGDLDDGLSPWFVPFEPGQSKAQGFAAEKFVRTVDAPSVLWHLAELFTERGIARAISDYLGERPAMIANKWILRRSPSGVAVTDFHQDGAFLGEGIRTVDCWIALSDCGPGTGRPAVELIPRRFDSILPTGGEATLPWALAESAVFEAAPDVPLCRPVLHAGDALLFDERLPHRTTQGPELDRRYAVESWFVAPSSYPSKHVPVVL